MANESVYNKSACNAFVGSDNLHNFLANKTHSYNNEETELNHRSRFW